MKPRENPFRSGKISALAYRLTDGNWAHLLARLEGLGRRAAVVGPKGTGKTTFLNAIAPRLETAGYRIKSIRLDEDQPKFAKDFEAEFFAGLRSNDFILFDGTEQLTFAGWQSFRFRARKAGGLLITLHRPGRLPTLLQTRSTPGLFEEIVRELDPSESRPPENELGRIFSGQGGNVRNALRELYDHYATR